MSQKQTPPSEKFIHKFDYATHEQNYDYMYFNSRWQQAWNSVYVNIKHQRRPK